MRMYFAIILVVTLVKSSFSQSSVSFLNKAKAEFILGNYNNTIKLCNKSIKKNPTLKETNFYLALSYFNIKDSANSLRCFRNEIRNNKSDYRSFIYAAKLTTTNYAIALADIESAVALQPTNFLVYLEKGNINYHYKQYELAIDDYKKAIAFRPNLDDAYYQLGFCALNLKDSANACQYWDKINELDDYPDYELIESICKKTP